MKTFKFIKRGSISSVLLFLLLFMLFQFISCTKEEISKDPETDFIEYENDHGEIGPGGGTITVADQDSKIYGTKVEIPADALNSIESISVSQNTNIIAPTDSNAIIVSFEPDGLQFSKPVTIYLPYNGQYDNPTVYYYNSETSLLEKLKVIEYDKGSGLVKAETDHFSDFYAGEDGVYANINMYNINGAVKCKVQFGGYSRGVKYWLGGIKLRFISNITGLISGIYNALYFLEHGKPTSTAAGIVIATIEVELRQDQLIGSKEIEKHLFGIIREEASPGQFYATIVEKQASGDLKEIYTTEILDAKGLDVFFSGEALIVNFNSRLDPGKKYYVKTSWLLSDMVNTGIGKIGTRFTDKYVISSKNKEKNGIWTLSNMDTSDPDKNNSGINDKYEIIKTKPTVTTSSASSITENSAKLGGNVTSDGNATVTERGIYYSTSSNPENGGTKVKIGSGTGSFSTTVTGLNPNTKYYVKAYAINSEGTGYGSTIQFTTAQQISLPSVTTSSASSITENSAKLGGNVTSDGNATVTERGIYYSTSSNPENGGTKVKIGSGTGSFSTTVTGLNPNTKYYVKAYAVNSKGTGYGSTIQFTTAQQISLPAVTTSSASSITENSAKLGGNVTSDGNSMVTERGIYYSTSSNPENGGTKVKIGSGTGSFSTTVTGLSSNTTYYVKAYAINSKGKVYGDQISFKTNNQTGLATVLLSDITDFDATWFIANGEVTNDGGLSVTERGFVYNTTGNPDLNDNKIGRGSGIGSFTFTFTSMSTNTTYYVRAYAINSKGTAYSEEKNVTLQGGLPTVSTSSVTDITETSATVGGNVSDEGGSSVTETGIYWGTSSNPETTGTKLSIGNGTGAFSTTLTGLSANTTYHIKAFAINSQGEALGSETSFTTNSSSGGETGTVTDYDGNVYKTVKIGNQWWMAENLKVTHYPNGDAIPHVTDNTAWANLGDNNTDDAYCFYNNNANGEKDIYGALYTWAAAMGDNAVSSTANPSGVQGVCPDGWHLPSDAEWKQLEMFLGMSESEANSTGLRGTNEGSKLAGNADLWNNGNLESNAEFGTSGFSALPGGYRSYGDSFYDVGNLGSWWSSTEGSSSSAYSRYLGYNYAYVSRYNFTKSLGFSVRCLRD